MKKRKLLRILSILAGLMILFIGISSSHLSDAGIKALRTWGGVCIGLGSALCSTGISGLYRLSYEKEFPDLAHKEEVENRDERNIMIQNKAKARSADIIQWFVMFAAWLFFFAGYPVWTSLVLIGVFVLRYGIEWYYIIKYQKEF